MIRHDVTRPEDQAAIAAHVREWAREEEVRAGREAREDSRMAERRRRHAMLEWMGWEEPVPEWRLCKRERERVANLSPERLERKRASDRITNMSPERRQRKRDADRAATMTGLERVRKSMRQGLYNRRIALERLEQRAEELWP